MGLTKQYLRYVSQSMFGVVGSLISKAVFVKLKDFTDRFIAVGACEHVLIWDIRKGEKVLTLEGAQSEVTTLCKSPDQKQIAVGYTDGSIRIFNIVTGSCLVTFQGHKSAISSLSYDHSGYRIVSGGKDTEIVVWDVINEAGMFRLRGHKGMITQCYFMRDRNILISSSKDSYVKFWNLDLQHCFYTLVGHRSEVWTFVLLKNNHLVTGAADSELRIWKLEFKDDDDLGNSISENKTAREDESDENNKMSCIKVGSIMRQGRDRVVSLAVDSTDSVLGCHGIGAQLELFKLLSEEEIEKRRIKKIKKANKKAKLVADGEESSINIEALSTWTIQDEIKKLNVFSASARIKAFDLTVEKVGGLKVLTLLGNNSLEMFGIDKEKAELINKLHVPGHRTDVRTLSFSSDNTGVLSASNEALKIWNRSSQQCVRTLKCDYALCSLFVPGDRHCLIGTKSGKVQIFDIASSQLLEDVMAHQGPVWSICLTADKKGICSGGSDKEVKFWNFELVNDSKFSESSKRLGISHSRTFELPEEVLCVKFTHDGRLLAVSLLDSTVKIFFVDTLKFFLSLYGHKFPVLCMDISDDNTLIVTGSSDRNIKIWSLNFGDCQKSIFAHDDSVMCLQFIPNTHMLFSGGKDGHIKQWDADSFQKIATLKGHQGEIWALAVSPNGQHLVTSSHDKSLRLWEKTPEILVLEEEQEMEREEEFEKGIVIDEEHVIPGERNAETGLASKKTIETMKAAEKLMEALIIYEEEQEKLLDYEEECKHSKEKLQPPAVNPLMTAYNIKQPINFMLHILKMIKSSELEEALLVLPFDNVIKLLEILCTILENGWETELVCRCLFFLMRIHHGQITSNHILLSTIDKLRSLSAQRVNEIRDTVGHNLAGLQFLQREIELKEEVALFYDATQAYKDKKKKRRKKEKLHQRVLLTL